MRKHEGKRPLVRPRHGWDDNVNVDVQEMGWVGMYWINPVDGKDSCCEQGNKHYGYIKCG